ncbi:MAG: cupin domain-containing protein [Clostridia bacterium]|nr:cupin domain-containing protein [Clostridia bacterium]
MPSIFNKDKLEMKLVEPELTEFSWKKSSKLNAIVQSNDYVFDIKAIGPGKFSYPYHCHYNSEEIFVILKGKITLRTPEGFQEISEGEFAFFEKGPCGAHQLYNHTDEICTYLDIRSKKDLDVCEYPDSNKINIMSESNMILTNGKAVDYFYKEDDVYNKWVRLGFEFNNKY